MQSLQIHSEGRYLCTEDGAPFFWLGDTAWELFHRLTREEATEYLQNRHDKGFNVIQAVALAEQDGLGAQNAYGRIPLRRHAGVGYLPISPDTTGDYSYWDHMDYIIREASRLGLYIALLPTWGDKVNRCDGVGPELFRDTDTAYTYTKWLAERYAKDANIIWVLGGDRDMEKRRHFEVECAMARGLRDGDGGTHLITFHPKGLRTSSSPMHEEEWLAFNMIQSCHCQRSAPNYAMIEHDYSLQPKKPVLDAEPCYEDHPVNFKMNNDFFCDVDVRKAAYWSVFAGACGHTYGHHCIWSMNQEPGPYFMMGWREAMDRPGAGQMQYLRALMESRPYFERVPAQEMLVQENRDGSNHMRATRGKRYAFLYTPHSMNLAVHLGQLPGEQLHAQWYDPRTGETTEIGIIDNIGDRLFVTPRHGWEMDYVLILDSMDD